MRETELYGPIKTFLENQGYIVKSEIRDCDVVAVRGEEPPVIVELKTGFTLQVLFQCVDRQSITDAVYVAFAENSGPGKSSVWRRHRRDIIRICKRLGLGLITISTTQRRSSFVEVQLDPGPYKPRKDKRRNTLLLKEFHHRVGDPNTGGSSKRPIITAYRQDALRCLWFIDRSGPAKLVDIRTETGVGRAAAILQRDVYGWFMRVERGTYAVTSKGQDAVGEFKDVILQLDYEAA